MTPERFWQKVDRSGDCWMWMGKQHPTGYAVAYVGGGQRNPRTRHAPRVAWELTHGPIPDGLCVGHRCGVRACCNPGHLYLGTANEVRANYTTTPQTHCPQGHSYAEHGGHLAGEKPTCRACDEARARYRQRVAPLAVLTQEIAQRLAAERSIPEPNSGCWLWEGRTDKDGYAYLSLRKVKYRMTRAVLGLPRGEPAGATTLMACHHCDTPSCVNPAHLFAGTNQDNMLDMRKKGRNLRKRRAA